LCELLIKENNPNTKMIAANNPNFSLKSLVALKHTTTKKINIPMLRIPQSNKSMDNCFGSQKKQACI